MRAWTITACLRMLERYERAAESWKRCPRLRGFANRQAKRWREALERADANLKQALDDAAHV